MKERLVLLGGSGFLGQSLLRWLEQRGRRKTYQVVVLDPNPPKFFSPDKYISGRLEETEKILAALKKGDLLLHLVHTTIPADSANAPQRELKENLEPTVKLLEALKGVSIKGLVYFSSGGTIYGEPEAKRPLSEEAPRRPGSFYALTKLLIEDALMAGGNMGWFKYLIVRPGNPYGPYQELLNRHGAVGRIFSALIAGEKFALYGKGETVRDYIYVDDLAQALMLLLKQAKWNRVFNIGSGKGISLKALIRLCQEASGKKLKLAPRPLRETDLKYNVLDCGKLKALGWKPETSLEQGLEQTWQYFLKK